MRILEIGLWSAFIVASIAVVALAPIFPESLGTNDPEVISASNSIYNQMNYQMVQNQTESIQSENTVVDYIVIASQWAWWAVIWLMMILSFIFFCGPALVILFNINTTLASFLTIGQVFLWVLAVAQYKSGKGSVDWMR